MSMPASIGRLPLKELTGAFGIIAISQSNCSTLRVSIAPTNARQRLQGLGISATLCRRNERPPPRSIERTCWVSIGVPKSYREFPCRRCATEA